MENGKIIVERKRRISERRYSVGIYIDNEFIVNTIKENRQEIELPFGIHKLKVEQGFLSGEIEIEVKKGKVCTYQFAASPFTYFTYSFLILALIAPYLFSASGDGVLMLYIPFLLAILYTYAAGRKKYFVIEKLQEEENWMQNF